jgi:hypothetical protein
MFPRLYNLSLQQSLSLTEVHSPTNTSLNLSWGKPLQSREFCIRESLLTEVERGPVFFDGKGSKIWKFHNSGIYSVFSRCDF